MYIQNSSFETFLWGVIKSKLFYIDGHCLNSGYCCQNIELKLKGKKIDTYYLFSELLENNKRFESFTPNLNPESKKIVSFNCKCLTSDNLCNAYETRPYVCRSYPYSVFNSEDYIREGCGYYIKMKKKLPKFSCNRLKQKVQCVKFNNRIK